MASCDVSHSCDLSSHLQGLEGVFMRKGVVDKGEQGVELVHDTTGWQSCNDLTSHRAVTLLCFHVYLKKIKGM